ncbi:MAG: hypothetical protein HC806_00785 [Anaerolineae bacterium]|nr:hypothetical protein [Anaerolineae bacterium]
MQADGALSITIFRPDTAKPISRAQTFAVPVGKTPNAVSDPVNPATARPIDPSLRR